MKQPIRLGVRVLALMLIACGIIWILQGINVLPGSFMTGQIQWAYRGGMIGAAGITLLILGARIHR